LIQRGAVFLASSTERVAAGIESGEVHSTAVDKAQMSAFTWQQLPS